MATPYIPNSNDYLNAQIARGQTAGQAASMLNPDQNTDYTRGGNNPLNNMSYDRTAKLSRMADTINNRLHLAQGGINSWNPNSGFNQAATSGPGKWDQLETEETRQMQRNRQMDLANSQQAMGLQYGYKRTPLNALNAGMQGAQQLDTAKFSDRLARGLGYEKAKEVVSIAESNPLIGAAFATIMGMQAPSIDDVYANKAIMGNLEAYRRSHPNADANELMRALMNSVYATGREQYYAFEENALNSALHPTVKGNREAWAKDTAYQDVQSKELANYTAKQQAKADKKEAKLDKKKV